MDEFEEIANIVVEIISRSNPVVALGILLVVMAVIITYAVV